MLRLSVNLDQIQSCQAKLEPRSPAYATSPVHANCPQTGRLRSQLSHSELKWMTSPRVKTSPNLASLVVRLPFICSRAGRPGKLRGTR